MDKNRKQLNQIFQKNKIPDYNNNPLSENLYKLYKHILQDKFPEYNKTQDTD